MNKESLELSVVIPIFYSANIFPELYERLCAAIETVTSSFEIIAVVDGCTDDSAEVVANFHERDKRVKLIEFSRNFGNQMAISAGLRRSLGEMVVVIDDDLEDPPELIPELIAKAREGFDVVYAKRRRRDIPKLQHSVFKSYYHLFNRLSNFDVPGDVGDYCLMRRPVIDVLNSMPENHRYVRGLRSWVGFKQTGIEFDREARHSGRSGFNFGGYFNFALDGIYSFSHVPLMLSTYLGFFISLVSFLLGVGFIIAKVAGYLPNVPGWASLAVIVLFIGGVQLLSLGVAGQYIGRIYDEVKRRPLYIVSRSVGFDEEQAARGGDERGTDCESS